MIYQISDNHLAAQEAAGLSIPARHRADHPRAQRLVVSRRAPRPRAGDAAACAAERALAGDTGRNARALRHRAAEEPRSRERRRGRGGRRAHRLSGRAENPLARHPAQDRGRRRGARPRDRAAVQRRRGCAAAVGARRAPGARIDGFLVQEMVSGVEAIVGARSDPLYGPMLLVGAGGVLVELAKDAALRLLPVSSGRRERDGRRPEARQAACRLSRPAGRRSRGARSRPCSRSADSFSIIARASRTSRSIR